MSNIASYETNPPFPDQTRSVENVLLSKDLDSSKSFMQNSTQLITASQLNSAIQYMQKDKGNHAPPNPKLVCGCNAE